MKRDQFLTEAMLPSLKGTKYISYNFSNWQGFGRLLEWAQKQEWWSDLAISLGGYPYEGGGHVIDVKFIHPDRFATAVYSFLKGLKL
jgi:hypothetical protein